MNHDYNDDTCISNEADPNINIFLIFSLIIIFIIPIMCLSIVIDTLSDIISYIWNDIIHIYLFHIKHYLYVMYQQKMINK